MGTILSYMIKGAMYGGMGAGGLILAGFAIEFLNLGCAILTCDCNKPMVFKWSGMWGLVLICIIGGAVIGLCYGFYKQKEESDAEAARLAAESSAEARKQRAKWASEIKQKALNVNTTCSRNKSFDRPLVSANYKTNVQMAEIMKELTIVAEKQGKVDAFAEELTEKGGASE